MLEILVRSATSKDLQQIVNIGQSVAISARDGAGEANDHGFLVSGYTAAEYALYLESQAMLLVSEVDGEIVGFQLSFDESGIKPDEMVNNLVKYNLDGPVTILKQVAVRDDYTGRGIASAMLNYLLERIDDAYLVSAVVSEPANMPSIRFHKRHGFQHIFDVFPPADRDGVIRPRAIWCRPAKNGDEKTPQLSMRIPDTTADLEALQNNLQEASSLYTHEDNLNWTKLGMQVSFLMAMFAAFAYLYEKEPTATHRIISILVIFFGYFLNYLLAVKIKSGLHYMSSHKDKIKLIEEKIRRLNPGIVPVIAVDDNGIAGQSQTVLAIGKVQYIAYSIWTICSLLLLLKQFAW